MEVVVDAPEPPPLQHESTEMSLKNGNSMETDTPNRSVESSLTHLSVESPKWQKNSSVSSFQRPLRHSTSDLPNLTPQLQQEMLDEEQNSNPLSKENPLARSVSEIVKAIETTQHPSPSASYPSFPMLPSPFYSNSTPSSPTSSLILGRIGSDSDLAMRETREKPRKRSFISPALLEGVDLVDEVAITEEENEVSANKCWCFIKNTKEDVFSPRLQSGEVDLGAVKEKQETRDKIQAERHKELQSREEIETQLIEEKLAEFHSSYDGYRNHAETVEAYNITEPNYIGFGVYLSSFMGAKSLEIMQALNIKFILIAARKLQQRYPQDLDYLQLDILDWPGEDILSHFDYSSDFMRDAIWSNSNVLVHCAAGVSRSASCVIAYIMREHNIGFYQARRLARMRRDCVKPNRGFVRQLLLWERFNYNIKCDREVYLGWKMEAYYKEAKMAPFSTVQLGIDPLELFTRENVDRLLKEYTSYEQDSVMDDFTLYCCKRCNRWLFTKLNMDEKTTTANFWSTDRMNWMKTLQVHGRVSCPRCFYRIGSYSLHHQIMDGENVPKFLVDKTKIFDLHLPVREIVDRAATESTILGPVEFAPSEKLNAQKNRFLTIRGQNTLNALLLSDASPTEKSFNTLREGSSIDL